jgi:hypothetical protein
MVQSFVLQRRFQGRLGDINIGFSELDDAARTVKLEEAKKRVRTLLVNNPYLTKQDVEDQLDEEGIRSIDVRFQNLNPKESYKIKINEVIAIVKELGHSHLKRSGLGSIYTSNQADFVYRLANDTPLTKRHQKGYNKLKSNGSAVPSIQEAMTKNCLEDLTACLHYSDDWEIDDDEEWDDIYPCPQVEAEPGTAHHRLKHGRLEDGYNKVCTVLLLMLLLFESILTFLPSFLT